MNTLKYHTKSFDFFFSFQNSWTRTLFYQRKSYLLIIKSLAKIFFFFPFLKESPFFNQMSCCIYLV